MSRQSSFFVRTALCAAGLAALSGCGPERNAFAPACPRATFLAQTADLAVYRPGSSGRDLTDMVLAGRMKGVNGECKPGKDAGTINTTVAVGVELMRGPAMTGRQANVPIYIAVVEGDRILDKRVYTLHADFPSNVDRVSLASPEVFMVLPVNANKSGAAYAILSGFQLSEDELATSRSRAPR